MQTGKTLQRIALTAAVLVSFLAMGGCATTYKDVGFKYSYDTNTRFSERRNYAWAPSASMYRKDPLLETNVQALADVVLAQKGFTRTSAQPDLTLSLGYEFEIGSSEDIYRLQSLNLYVYRVEGKDLVWRGTAFGAIKTDAASGELKQTVQGILANFPPN